MQLLSFNVYVDQTTAESDEQRQLAQKHPWARLNVKPSPSAFGQGHSLNLALAALRSATANTADESAVKELVERLGSGDASLLGDVNAEAMDAAADLAADLDAVDALVEAQGSEPDEETARAVDKKLRAWPVSYTHLKLPTILLV